MCVYSTFTDPRHVLGCRPPTGKLGLDSPRVEFQRFVQFVSLIPHGQIRTGLAPRDCEEEDTQHNAAMDCTTSPEPDHADSRSRVKSQAQNRIQINVSGSCAHNPVQVLDCLRHSSVVRGFVVLLRKKAELSFISYFQDARLMFV